MSFSNRKKKLRKELTKFYLNFLPKINKFFDELLPKNALNLLPKQTIPKISYRFFHFTHLLQLTLI
jgi:hypothetical protein